ncbi:hypothetical protein E3P84_02181 [Wallemia ichthyophaga]|nr:hypothetical protein E3P84_02181 [Wallemia ichthyophaga]TIB41247.1 hypothetical protein E3P83_02134 [Wallemia ichthyophaga]
MTTPLIKLGVDATARSLARLPSQNTPIIHIAGTNGKGSTSAYVDALLTAFGCVVGRFNSPHLVQERDSICVGGAVIDRQAYDATREHLAHDDSNYNTLTGFEKLTVTAFSLFGSERVDVAVVEVGMGGLHDATNAFSREERDSVAVITPIALDHQSWLGSTVEEITAQKIGIITAHTTAAVVAPQIHPLVVEQVRKRCEELGVPLYVGGQEHERDTLTNPSTGARIHTQLSMAGAHQMENASTALLTLHAFKMHCRRFRRFRRFESVGVDDELVRHTLSHVRFRGRSDRYAIPGAVVDGAHNPAAARHLRDTLPNHPHQFILAFSQDKEVAEMLKVLVRPADKIVFVPFSTPPSMPWVGSMDTHSLKSLAEGIFNGSVQVSTADSVQSALKECTGNVVIAGSLYLVADVYRDLLSAHFKHAIQITQQCVQFILQLRCSVVHAVQIASQPRLIERIRLIRRRFEDPFNVTDSVHSGSRGSCFPTHTMAQAELKLAILVCDSTLASIEAEEGDCERIFGTFLHTANDALNAPFKLIIDAFDVYEDRYPEDVTIYDGVIISGSTSDAYSEEDWVVDLADYISGLVNSFKRTKVLGVCFGHQLLARALGGVVQPGDMEMGSTAVRVCDGELAAKYFGCNEHQDTFNVLQAHRDVVHVAPPMLTTVAATETCKHQAFVKLIDGVVQCWSVQGHPEFTPSIMRKVVEAETRNHQTPQQTRDEWLGRAQQPHDGIALGKAILNFDFLNADIHDSQVGLAVYRVRTLRHRFLSRSKKSTIISAGSNHQPLATIHWEHHLLQISSESVALSKIQSYLPSKRGIICRHFQWDSKHYELSYDDEQQRWKATASDQLTESATFHPPRRSKNGNQHKNTTAHGMIADDNDRLFLLMLFIASHPPASSEWRFGDGRVTAVFLARLGKWQIKVSGGEEVYSVRTPTHFGRARIHTVIRKSGGARVKGDSHADTDTTAAVIDWKEHRITISDKITTSVSLGELHSMQATHAGKITRHWQLNGKYYHIEYVVPQNGSGADDEHAAYWEATPSDDDNGAAWFLPPQTNMLGKLKRLAQFEMNDEVDDWGDRIFLLTLFIYSQTRLSDSKASENFLTFTPKLTHTLAVFATDTEELGYAYALLFVQLNDTQILELTEQLKQEESSGRALVGDAEDMSGLLAEYENGNAVYTRKIANLMGGGYSTFRRIRGDGNCFYRAVSYAFVEKVCSASTADTTKERLQRVTIPLLSELGFDSEIMQDFYQPLLTILDNTKDPSIPLNEYLKVTLNDDETSNSIVVFLRYLTSATIRKHADEYLPFLFAYEGDLVVDDSGMPDIKKFCETYVEAFGKEADHIQMTALGRVLQVDLKVCYLDASEKEHVDWHELGVSGDESGEGNVITLLYRPGHVDLMYK